ncbi:MAG: protein kinase [Bradymonadaceae bacterium]|nr:protein kinase [Lujinxingiaceae bacterium]
MKPVRGVAIGETFAGRYELVEELGRGGFGVVYRAKQAGMARELAIKILFPSQDAHQAEQVHLRFQREALMVSNLSHPNTIRQYDFGETDEGVMFFVMEYLKGRTLDDILTDDGPISEQRTINVARGVLKSLCEAHSFDIVHRDLKPGNIMMCEIHGESDFVKVLDFGIAKTSMGQHDITSAGMTLGSPRYMAPELLRGESPLPACDLYSLGLTLVECMTGQPVIPANHALQQARVQLSNDPLDIPEHIKALAIWPWLSLSVEKDAQRRFQSAEAMLNALEQMVASPPPALLDHDPITAPLTAIPSRQATPQPDEDFDGATQRLDGAEVIEAIRKQRLTLPPLDATPHQATMPLQSVSALNDVARELAKLSADVDSDETMPGSSSLPGIYTLPPLAAEPLGRTSQPTPIQSSSPLRSTRPPTAGFSSGIMPAPMITRPPTETGNMSAPAPAPPQVARQFGGLIIDEGTRKMAIGGGVFLLVIFVLIAAKFFF